MARGDGTFEQDLVVDGQLDVQESLFVGTLIQATKEDGKVQAMF